MSDPKKHHFSPVFYLKGWCNPESKVVEYSRPYREVVARTVSPSATGFKHFLYTLESAPEDQKQVIEKDHMAPAVDNRAAVALEILMHQDGGELTDEVRNDWTRFLMASLLRRPQAINDEVAIYTNVLKENLTDVTAYESLKKEGDLPTPFEWIQKYYPYLASDYAKKALTHSIENPILEDIIVNMQWATFDLSKSKHGLLTSDSPNLRTTGLNDNNCLIAFPLSPRVLFIATHDRKAESALLACGETAIVRWVNDNIVRAAERYVYGRTNSHLRFVEKRLRLPGTLGPIIPPY
jgi:hypothetical protein